jgi:predicted glycogen debranching enzyme
VQLTWMDAKVGDWVVTPRDGKPVEVQALWYNALRILEDFARQFGDAEASRYARMAEAAAASFSTLLWNAELNCLYDVVARDGIPDASLRPNQIFAVSLPHTMLTPDRARQVVDIVERELFTPGGLRTLSPSDPAYRGRYEGDQRSRDAAYHQGTVWPWLMGPFITAYLKTHGEAGRAQAKTWAMGCHSHLTQAGLGQISEIFDGDFPEEPRGTIAQAWSVAELLRAALEVIR